MIPLTHSFSYCSHGERAAQYTTYFTVESPMGRWRLRADTQEGMDTWVQALQAAAGAPPVILSIKQVSHIHISTTQVVCVGCAGHML
jgi:hypothetical protein